ncbi:MAG: Brp/Blh family beta-carotene 15,15'-dioxygenase [Tenacibaculum sp.]
MIKNQYFKICISFFALWFFSVIPDKAALVLCYFSIFSLGLLHGTNDLEILSKIYCKKLSFVKYLSVYLLLISIAALLFILFKKIAFALFLLLSFYHFGEQHLNSKSFVYNWLKPLTYIIYGLFIFSILILNNFNEVIAITQKLFEIVLSKEIFIYTSWISILLFISILVYNSFNLNTFSTFFEEVLYALLLYILFKASPLIVGFSVYFIVWHSIPSILDQIHFLYGSSTVNSMLNYLKKSFLFWFISIVAVVFIYYFEDSLMLSSTIFGVLFVVSVPHIFVILLMNFMQKK